MPLLSLWNSDPSTVSSFTVEQVVSFAGDGKLRDGSLCSSEFRTYLSSISSEKIFSYVDYCLSNTFSNSGSVLQDLINELGRRLDYKVENGLYTGKVGAIGHDGLWHSPDAGSLVVEVKTSDAYRISIESISTYRKKLIGSGKITSESSILIVVGRQDTGELEAQVRGSRHAWDVRLISAEALSKLVALKENSDEPETGKKIRSVLVPVEYTRVDALVDVLFTTATDIETQGLQVDSEDLVSQNEITNSLNKSPSSGFTDAKLLQAKRDQIITSLSEQLNTSLVKKSRATFWSPNHNTRIVCTLSKRYDTKVPYWYAYHFAWNEFLQHAEVGYLVLGCMDQNFAFSTPVKDLQPILSHLNTTETKKTPYWHIHLVNSHIDEYELVVPGEKNLNIGIYKVSLKHEN